MKDHDDWSPANLVNDYNGITTFFQFFFLNSDIDIAILKNCKIK